MTDPLRPHDAPPAPAAHDAPGVPPTSPQAPATDAWVPAGSSPWPMPGGVPSSWTPQAPQPGPWSPGPSSHSPGGMVVSPPPPPVPLTGRASGGFGGRRVPGAIVAILAPVLAVVFFAGGILADRTAMLGAAAAGPVATPTGSPAAGTGLVDEAWRVIHDKYVDPKSLDDQKLAYGAIRGIVDAIGDEGHTSFMTADESRASDQSLSGSFVGIGVQVSVDDAGKIQVSTVFANTPAQEAGLRRGDHILAVDGKTTLGETVDQTVSRVRGPEGQTVTLTIGRSGTSDFDVTITRRTFDLPLIAWAMVPGTKVALIRLDQFATGATDALRKAITDVKADGATGLIFDLRSNPGGYVAEAVGVASQFLADGIVYQSFGRTGERKDGSVLPGGLATDIPLVVLANGQTASSSEIVTGAIQDAKRGTVVGDKTFGTGTVLVPFKLSDGSVLRIGVERWLTRGGRPIWHEGLEPDVKVTLPDTAQPVLPETLRDMTAAQLQASTDDQLKKAVELLTKGQ
jgi:carboxyl-terminal processing protease